MCAHFPKQSTAIRYAATSGRNSVYCSQMSNGSAQVQQK